MTRWLKVKFLDREWNRAMEGAALCAENLWNGKISEGMIVTKNEQRLVEDIAAAIRRRKRN